MTTPLVSVIIPCYRQGHYLAETLESVLRQTYPAVEIIVVNDGSDDDTEAVAKSYGSKIKYVFQPNGGLSAARNLGVRHARGDWVQLLDADDHLSPEKTATQVEAVRNVADVDIVYGGYWCFSENRPGELWTCSKYELGADPFLSFVREWERGLSIPFHGFLFKRKCFDRWGMFDPKLPNHEDWDWHLRCAAGGAVFHYVPGQTALYRMTPISMSRGKASVEKMRRGKYACLEKHLNNAGLTRSQRRAVRERYVTERADEIWWELRFRRIGAAAKALRPLIAYDRIPSLGSVLAWGEVTSQIALRLFGAAGRKIGRLLSRSGRPADQPDRPGVVDSA